MEKGMKAHLILTLTLGGTFYWGARDLGAWGLSGEVTEQGTDPVWRTGKPGFSPALLP